MSEEPWWLYEQKAEVVLVNVKTLVALGRLARVTRSLLSSNLMPSERTALEQLARELLVELEIPSDLDAGVELLKRAFDGGPNG